ncbi:MAG TPA: Hpt domain-containing protein [Spirochaetia bacterium]|nr:Hpt domain-containing protein [Spirochaetia bacterium]
MPARQEGEAFKVGGVVAEVADEQTIVELLCEYSSFLLGQLTELQHAFKALQSAEVHRIAHLIHGGALVIQASALAAAAEKLEKVTKSGMTSTVDSLISGLVEEVDRLANAVNRRACGRTG